MAEYTRTNRDKAYRKVNITATANPKFVDFKEPGEVVNYPNMAVVLEVLHYDGTTELYYEGAQGSVANKAGSPDTFGIISNVPTARLWVCRTDGTGIPYKIPENLPQKDGLALVLVPAGTRDMEIVGDKYFEKVYELK